MDIDSKIESILFLSPKSLRIQDLAMIVEGGMEDVEHALRRLETVYNVGERGIRIATNGDHIQMTTAPKNEALVVAFVEDEVRGKLTRPQLETLTVIAYRGPITKSALEHVRGVNCSVIIRNLLVRGLIEGLEDPERLQTVYTITMDFLHVLGIQKVEDLPEYEHLHVSETIDRILGDNTEPEKDE
jgi:segregation and condensation protein B